MQVEKADIENLIDSLLKDNTPKPYDDLSLNYVPIEHQKILVLRIGANLRPETYISIINHIKTSSNDLSISIKEKRQNLKFSPSLLVLADIDEAADKIAVLTDLFKLDPGCVAPSMLTNLSTKESTELLQSLRANRIAKLPSVIIRTLLSDRKDEGPSSLEQHIAELLDTEFPSTGASQLAKEFLAKSASLMQLLILKIKLLKDASLERKAEKILLKRGDIHLYGPQNISINLSPNHILILKTTYNQSTNDSLKEHIARVLDRVEFYEYGIWKRMPHLFDRSTKDYQGRTLIDAYEALSEESKKEIFTFLVNAIEKRLNKETLSVYAEYSHEDMMSFIDFIDQNASCYCGDDHVYDSLWKKINDSISGYGEENISP